MGAKGDAAKDQAAKLVGKIEKRGRERIEGKQKAAQDKRDARACAGCRGTVRCKCSR